MTTIRPFREADLEGVLSLWTTCDLTRPWNPPAADIAFCRTSGHGELFVSEREGRIVGTVMAGHDGHRGWLYYVAVDPELRRSGLGRELTAHGETWLRALGVRKVMLLIRETNTAVKGFYEALGYEEEPRVLMTKWLNR